MQISEIDQEVTDFDWYAVDTQGYLLHFASGGGPLPASVAASSEALAQVHAYFSSLPRRTQTVTLTSLLAQLVPGVTESNRYVASFVTSAQRGLFAFDRSDPGHRSLQYHLVASPIEPLVLSDIPADIAAIVSRTRLEGTIMGHSPIDAQRIL